MGERAPRPDLGPCPGESPFLGLHHAALVTLDMNRTVTFYTDVLGLPIVATARGETESGHPCRRYWFDAGQGTTILFVERTDAQFHPSPSEATDPARPHPFIAMCLRVRGEQDLEAVQERLVQSGVDVTPIEDRGLWKRVRFTDPNGITVEAGYWKSEAYPPFEEAYRDHDPVPALRELSLP